MNATIAALNIYPIKSCRGIALGAAELATTGLAHDRQWLVVNELGRFLTQRELPRLALIGVALAADTLQLTAPGEALLDLPVDGGGPTLPVTVWRDTVQAQDCGATAARWLSNFLATNVRLVKFAGGESRLSNREFTKTVAAANAFSDGYPILAVSEASLADLNERLPSGVGPLPMNRFRPNIVLSAVPAYAEDAVYELRGDGVVLRAVKPCTRCVITTTDQATGVAEGDEPLRTLRGYRFDAKLRGVTFGQNLVIVAGIGKRLSVGQVLQVIGK